MGKVGCTVTAVVITAIVLVVAARFTTTGKKLIAGVG